MRSSPRELNKALQIWSIYLGILPTHEFINRCPPWTTPHPILFLVIIIENATYYMYCHLTKILGPFTIRHRLTKNYLTHKQPLTTTCHTI